MPSSPSIAPAGMYTRCAPRSTFGTLDPQTEQKPRGPLSAGAHVEIFSVPSRQRNVARGPATSVANNVP